jgi:CRISPR-associated exonuclease Cas4
MGQLGIAALALLAVALILLWVSGALRRRAGMPAGRLVYSDTRRWQAVAEPLYASSANLTGRPDYLVRRWNRTIPVEVKSTAPPAEPYRSHVLQLAAYCLLVEETYGQRPPYGLLHYTGGDGAEQTFAVRYTRALGEELLGTMEWMREDWQEKRAERDHDDPARCRSCSYAEYCDQRLV